MSNGSNLQAIYSILCDDSKDISRLHAIACQQLKNNKIAIDKASLEYVVNQPNIFATLSMIIAMYSLKYNEPIELPHYWRQITAKVDIMLNRLYVDLGII